MGSNSVQSKVQYCCISKGNQIIYAYGGRESEMENLAASCLERAPPFHRWYFETVGRRTFGFLMEEEHVYFAIVDDGVGKRGLLKFLEQTGDEFKKGSLKGSMGSFLNMNSATVQEQLVPAVRSLITALEHVSQSGNDRGERKPARDQIGTSSLRSGIGTHTDTAGFTGSPLRCKSTKKDRKQHNDLVIAASDVELEEHYRATDGHDKTDSVQLNLNDGSEEASSAALQKNSSSFRIRSGPQNIRRRWWRIVQIVLLIDAGVCLVLFVIWLSVCRGLGCTH